MQYRVRNGLVSQPLAFCIHYISLAIKVAASGEGKQMQDIGSISSNLWKWNQAFHMKHTDNQILQILRFEIKHYNEILPNPHGFEITHFM